MRSSRSFCAAILRDSDSSVVVEHAHDARVATRRALAAHRHDRYSCDNRTDSIRTVRLMGNGRERKAKVMKKQES